MAGRKGGRVTATMTAGRASSLQGKKGSKPNLDSVKMDQSKVTNKPLMKNIKTK